MRPDRDGGPLEAIVKLRDAGEASTCPVSSVPATSNV